MKVCQDIMHEFVIKDAVTQHKYLISEIKNKIILGDTFEILPKIPDESVDLVFIDPPYFLQLPNKELRRWTVKTVVEGVNDVWDKFSSFQEYDKFIQKLLTEVKRVMKPTATIWVIATYHSIFRIGKIMQDLGYWIIKIKIRCSSEECEKLRDERSLMELLRGSKFIITLKNIILQQK
jgi:DNA modification methylase